MKRIFLLVLLAAPLLVAGPIVGLSETQHMVVSFDASEFAIPIAHRKPIRPNWEFIDGSAGVEGVGRAFARCSNPHPMESMCEASVSFYLQLDYGGEFSDYLIGSWIAIQHELQPGETKDVMAEFPVGLSVLIPPYSYGATAPAGGLRINALLGPAPTADFEPTHFEFTLDVGISSAFEAPEPATLPVMASALGLLAAVAGARKIRAGRGKR